MHTNIPAILLLHMDQRGRDITACLCDRQADWDRLGFICLGWVFVCWWNAEQKSLNVRDRQAALHLATILSPLPGQFTKSKGFSVVCEAGEMEREGGGPENRQRDNR